MQETDHLVPVRGARIVLDDTDGVRAPMTASWLARMGWEVYLLQTPAPVHRSSTGVPAAPRPDPPAASRVAPATLSEWLADPQGGVQVLDVTASANYLRGHVPGAWFAICAQLAQALRQVPRARRYVVTCGSSLLARHAADDLSALTGAEVWVLEGGTAAWAATGLPLETGDTRLAVPRIDRYRRPYEGTDAPREAMQAYLDWEFGLVAQLARDGTHHFTVL